MGCKSLLILSGVIGLALNWALIGQLAMFLPYYTMQSNIVCTVLFLVLLGLEWRDRMSGRIGKAKPFRYWLYQIKAACTLYILITPLVFHLIIGPQLFEMAPSYQRFSLSDLLIHYITPLLVLIDHFLFDPKGRFRLRDPFGWAILPLSYLFFVDLYSRLGGRFFLFGDWSEYPYFFLDSDNLSIIGVGKWILNIAALYFGAAYGILAVDALIVQCSHRIKFSHRIKNSSSRLKK